MENEKTAVRKALYILCIFLGIMLVMPLPGHCFTVTAQVDKTRITDQDTVALQVVVDGGQADVDLSPVTDFEVTSSGTSTNRSYSNGEWTHQVIYQYLLVPRKSGVLKIPPLTISQGHETQVTQEIQILMSEPSPSQGETRQFFARASLSTGEMVLGQQAVYSLKLYAAINFSGATFNPPGFQGLTAKELGQWKKYTQTMDGQTFRVNEMNYLIQPDSLGEIVIEPAIFMAQVPVGQNQNTLDSFLNDSFFKRARTKQVRVVSNPVSLEVISLPAYSGDQPFSGLVGSFTMGATMDRTQLKVGESATLTIVIQGVGNIMDAGAVLPVLDPDQFKTYEDAPVETIQATEKGVAGKKVFRLVLVPKVPGLFTIPSMGLTFFDMETRAYKPIVTEPVALDIAPDSSPSQARAGSMDSGGTPKGIAPPKKEVVMLNRDILDIKEDFSILSSAGQFPFWVFTMMVLCPGVIFVGFSVFLGFRKKEKTIQTLMKEKARAHLKWAQKTDPGDPRFLTHVQAALNAAVLARGDKQAETVTRAEALAVLEKSQTDSETTDGVLALLDTMDAARFGGKIMDEHQSLACLAQVRDLVKVLGLVFCLAITSIFATPQVGHAADTTGLFIDGTQAYKAGEYKAAAQSFEAIATLGVKNPDLFYNIGNAYLKSDDLGHAVLWYERARRLAPRDPDLLFNLAHAQGLVKDKIESSLNVTDILFFWQGLISLKWLQFLALGSSLFFFLWAGVLQYKQKKVFSGTGTLIFILFCFLFLVVCLETHRIRADHEAVIVSQTVTVRSGTMETATPLFDLHAGTKVKVFGEKPGYLKIQVAKGKMGWVAKKDATVI